MKLHFLRENIAQGSVGDEGLNRRYSSDMIIKVLPGKKFFHYLDLI